MKLVIAAVVAALMALPTLARPAEACTGPAPAQATPKQVADAAPDVFALLEAADVAAEVEVTSVPGFTNEGHGKAGDVVLTVRTVLVGTPGKTITIHQAMTPCGGETVGRVFVGFFDKRGALVGEGAASTEPALHAWTTVGLDTRLPLLTRFAHDKDPQVAGAAVKHRARFTWRDPAPGWRAPGSRAAAVSRVRAQWPTILAAAPQGRLADFDEAMRTKRCTLEASAKEACADIAKQMVAVDSPAALGDAAVLATGDCWDVTCPVGFFTLNVYVAASSGRVLAVWIPPEG